jgi:hypothetical protein
VLILNHSNEVTTEEAMLFLGRLCCSQVGWPKAEAVALIFEQEKTKNGWIVYILNAKENETGQLLYSFLPVASF